MVVINIFRVFLQMYRWLCDKSIANCRWLEYEIFQIIKWLVMKISAVLGRVTIIYGIAFMIWHICQPIFLCTCLYFIMFMPLFLEGSVLYWHWCVQFEFRMITPVLWTKQNSILMTWFNVTTKNKHYSAQLKMNVIVMVSLAWWYIHH